MYKENNYYCHSYTYHKNQNSFRHSCFLRKENSQRMCMFYSSVYKCPVTYIPGRSEHIQ